MLYEAIDHVFLPVDQAEAAVAAFERLGCPVSQPLGASGGSRLVCFGGPTNLFMVELLLPPGPHPVPAAGPGLSSVALRVADMAAALAELRARGVEASSEVVRNAQGEKVLDLAILPDVERGIVPFVLQEFVVPVERRHARYAEQGLFGHRLPFRRLDHLAAMAPDLDAATRYWTDTLGIPQTGEVTNPAMIIRQFKIGDANFELVGPASPDSPLRNRPPGLMSMVALEVTDLVAAVGLAREAGFTVSEPAPGALPGTRTATIAADQLAGLSLQLLAYG